MHMIMEQGYIVIVGVILLLMVHMTLYHKKRINLFGKIKILQFS